MRQTHQMHDHGECQETTCGDYCKWRGTSLVWHEASLCELLIAFAFDHSCCFRKDVCPVQILLIMFNCVSARQLQTDCTDDLPIDGLNDSHAVIKTWISLIGDDTCRSRHKEPAGQHASLRLYLPHSFLCQHSMRDLGKAHASHFLPFFLPFLLDWVVEGPAEGPAALLVLGCGASITPLALAGICFLPCLPGCLGTSSATFKKRILPACTEH